MTGAARPQATSPHTWDLDRRLLVLLLCAPLIGLLGVVVAELVPDGRIGYHLIRAEAAGVLGPTQRSASPLGTTTDHFSECVAFAIGLGDPPGQNVVANALTSPNYGGCERLTDELEVLAATDTLAEGSSYLRYWHGYAVITRPALAIFGVAGARWIAFGLLAAAVVAMAASVKRAFGTVTTGLLVLPPLLTTDMVIAGLSMHQSLGTATAWLGGWMAFAVTSRHPSWRTAALVAALAGAVNAYIDLMTTIPGALALTAIGATLGVIASGTDPGLRSAWRVTAAAAVGWSVGLVWMWGAKWVLAAIVVGVDAVVDNVKTQIEFRLSGEYEFVSSTRTQGLTDNLGVWWGQPLTPWVIAAAIGVVVAVAWRTRRRQQPWVSIATCCAIVAVPVVAWFFVLNNHSQIHAWLVYRSLPIAFGGLCALVVAALTTTASPEPAAGAPADDVIAAPVTR